MTRNQDGCGLVQLRHTVPGPILYQSYWYRSGVNQTMTRNLHGIARATEELAGLEAGDLVIDIGCNDGTLFDGYATRNVRFLGFDPSDVTRYAIEKGYGVERDFFSARALERRYPDQRAKAITSIAMFYDLEDPAAFVRDVADSLAEDGVWVMELHYLPTMLEIERLRRDRPRAPRVLLARGDRAPARPGRAERDGSGAQRRQRRLDPPVHLSRRAGAGRRPPRPPSASRSCACGSSRWPSTRPLPTRASPPTSSASGAS